MITLKETLEKGVPFLKYFQKGKPWGTIKNFVYDLAIAEFSDFRPRFYISKEVKDLENSDQIIPYLNGIKHYDKGKIYKILNKDIVHEEHIVPNKVFQNKLEELNVIDFEEFVRNNFAIAIILKDENKKLDRNGYKCKRRDTLNQALKIYKELNIIVDEVLKEKC